MMHSDSRVKEPVCLATTSLPDPCLSTYLSPRFREEPKIIRSLVVQIPDCFFDAENKKKPLCHNSCMMYDEIQIKSA